MECSVNDRYHRWAAGILAFVVFLFFLADIVEFVAWKYGNIVRHFTK
jgi:hypothetical protein